ncbi:MAG: Lar family restriction alleviation protein [Synergistaceae bacterium]|nr:Lar family restriction alleviation protein [Synergistaceae bacterium]
MSEFLAKGVKRHLKYCPFCGATSIRACDKTYYYRQGEERMYWYECKHCKSRSGEYHSREEAAGAWNRRFIDE